MLANTHEPVAEPGPGSALIINNLHTARPGCELKREWYNITSRPAGRSGLLAPTGEKACRCVTSRLALAEPLRQYIRQLTQVSGQLSRFSSRPAI